MNDRTLGTCSHCGGPVTVPYVWGGTIPPVPTCQICGAMKKNPYGPVIDMGPPRQPAPYGPTAVGFPPFVRGEAA